MFKKIKLEFYNNPRNLNDLFSLLAFISGIVSGKLAEYVFPLKSRSSAAIKHFSVVFIFFFFKFPWKLKVLCH